MVLAPMSNILWKNFEKSAISSFCSLFSKIGPIDLVLEMISRECQHKDRTVLGIHYWVAWQAVTGSKF